MRLKLSIFLILVCSYLTAQKYSGNHFGGYSGVYGIQENPASFVTKKPKWDINIFGTGLWAYTEYGYIANQSILSMQDRTILNATDSIPANYNPETNALFYANAYSQPINGLTAQQTIHLPSFCFKVNQFSFGLFTNAKWAVDAIEAPVFFNYQNLKEIIRGTSHTITPFSVNGMAWGEIGLNFGYAHTLENDHILSLGINPKYLLGFEAGYVQNKSTYKFVRVEDTFFSSAVNVGFGFASGASTNSNNYNFGVHGTGLGIDIGAEYLIPSTDEESNSPYDMKFGLAIKDFGSIKFDDNTEQHNFALNNVDFGVVNNILNNRDNNYTVVERLSVAVYNGDSSRSLVSREMRMYTPTSISAYWDYNIRKDFYIHAYATRRLKTMERQIAAPNVWMLSGRYEKRWFEAGAAISLTEDKWFGVGTYIRLGLLTIGSDHINAIFLSQPRLRGADVYMSLKLMPFGKRKEKEAEIDYIGGGGGRKYGCRQPR